MGPKTPAPCAGEQAENWIEGGQGQATVTSFISEKAQHTALQTELRSRGGGGERGVGGGDSGGAGDRHVPQGLHLRDCRSKALQPGRRLSLRLHL
jgi:hypothetical protein